MIKLEPNISGLYSLDDFILSYTEIVTAYLRK